MALMSGEQLKALYEFLEGPDGCNFQEDSSAPLGHRWTCDHTLRKTSGWLLIYLNSIAEADENAHAIMERDGYCDCEVLFNVIEQKDDGSYAWREIA